MSSIRFKNTTFLSLVLILLAGIGISLGYTADVNQDGLSAVPQSGKDFGNAETNPTPGLTIGMIQTGNYSSPQDRLSSLGYSIDLIPPDSGLGTFQQYDIVYLPLQWAQADVGDYGTIESHAADYQAYVQSGGGLFIDQPNPYQQPDDTVTPTLLPYPITFYNWYDENDWPPIIVDPNHEITQGLSADEMPFPFDQMINVDSNYDILVIGQVTGSASLAVLEYGSGRILVQTAHPTGTIHPFSDEVYIRMVNWVGDIGKGAINGHITDADTGDAIKWAFVIAIQKPTKKWTLSNSDGYYELEDLPPGDWWVIVIKKGYKAGFAKVVVNADGVTTKDFALNPR